MDEIRKVGCAVVSLLGFLIFLGVTCMIGCPRYTVYHQEMEGKAELARATYSRQIAVTESHAKYESAIELAKADTVRAHGVATSNAIIGASLRNNSAYLTWLYIENLKEGKNDVIYIPTEAGLPILEAGKLSSFGRGASADAKDEKK